jgi:cytochrome c oxidase subunit 2
VTSTSSEWSDLWSVYLPIAIGVAIVVWAAIGVAVVRYRRRPDRDPGGPAERTRLELGLAAGLAGVVAFLVALTFSTEAKTDSDPPGQVTIRVVAFQWGWRFVYPSSGAVVTGSSDRPPTFAVPVGETVHFDLTSRDVVHNFWVPSQRFKRAAFPGIENHFDLRFDSPGLNAGRCAEFCGLRHDAMDFNVLALEPERYRAWIAERRGRAA